ncbi:MAG: cytochrome b N-terminal domain-containing protein [Blastocatellia bacterium]|nr:cytochrome b N-terminal domain-containing protein [Blastocatellia bacterium]
MARVSILTRMAATRTAEFRDWFDERTGASETARAALAEPIRGGARWTYVFGSGLAFLAALQALTGIALSIYYVPSSDHAHASVVFIQKAVPAGALLRGLHHYGASAMIVLIVMHLTQVFLFGAYKAKRELVWVTGVVMLLVILAFAFTGYLLPWDQAAYFGTKVGTSIAGEVPVIGEIQRRIMLGGTDLTTLTLSRFFTAHILLFPLALLVMIATHILLFRRAGAAGPYHRRDDHRVDSFYPKQMLMDAVFMLILFVALAVLSTKWPAELGPQADPTSDYLARPPWYFLPLFQLLKYFPGKLSLIPTVLLPGALFTTLLLLPFADRRAERHPLRRPIATGMLALILAGAAGLIVLSKYEDRTNKEFSVKIKEQEEAARAFMTAKFQPQVIGQAIAAMPAAGAPPAAFSENCAMCHGDRGEGNEVGPALTGITEKPGRAPEDLLKLLKDSRAYGLKDPMPESFELAEDEKRQIVEWLKKLK